MGRGRLVAVALRLRSNWDDSVLEDIMVRREMFGIIGLLCDCFLSNNLLHGMMRLN